MNTEQIHNGFLDVYLEDQRFRYHTHEIAAAFFPADKITYYTDKESETAKIENCLHIQIAEEESDFTIRIHLWLSGERVWESVYRVSESPCFRDSKDAPLLNRARKSLKAELYKAFSETMKRELPWGSMTGIRPAKIVNTLFQAGLSRQEIFQELKEKYSVSEAKANLAVQVSETQAQLLESSNDSGISLYIGIPFCPTRCLYCSFTSESIGRYRGMTEAYLDVLLEEMQYTASLLQSKPLSIQSVYVGGGTPTSLEAEQLDRLFQGIETIWGIRERRNISLKEYCVEAGRPDSIDAQKLQVLKRHTISRISINPQTLHDETLRIIGRQHTAQQFFHAFQSAREHGFSNINVDIIAGLPGETYAMFQETLDGVLALQPENITVHTMSIKRASDLKKNHDSHRLTDGSEVEQMVTAAYRQITRAGLRPFYMYRQKNMLGNLENVSYSKPGYESPYNVHIMEEDQTILAFGCGGVSKFVQGGRIERAFNVKNVEEYIKRKEEMMDRKRNLVYNYLVE